MNGGAFGENFPYSNFHDLNMDWIIKIAKDFLDQYTNIQQTITEGLEGLDNKAQELEALLQEWYDTHSEDIANQLADALNDLNSWYTEHEGYLDQYVTDSIQEFNDAADQKAAQTIASIPSDYTTLSNDVNDLKSALPYNSYNLLPKQNDTSGSRNGITFRSLNEVFTMSGTATASGYIHRLYYSPSSHPNWAYYGNRVYIKIKKTGDMDRVGLVIQADGKVLYDSRAYPNNHVFDLPNTQYANFTVSYYINNGSACNGTITAIILNADSNYSLSSKVDDIMTDGYHYPSKEVPVNPSKNVRQTFETEGKAVYLFAEGTYNLASSFTPEEIQNASYSSTGNGFCGVRVPDGSVIKGVGDKSKIIIRCELSTSYSISARTSIATLNLLGDCLIENVTVVAVNARTPIHDDFRANENKTHIIKNCVLRNEVSERTSSHGYGLGLVNGETVIMENCDIYPTMICHSNTNFTTSPSLKMENCNVFSQLTLQDLASVVPVHIDLINTTFGSLEYVSDNIDKAMKIRIASETESPIALRADANISGFMYQDLPARYAVTKGQLIAYSRTGTFTTTDMYRVAPTTDPVMAIGVSKNDAAIGEAVNIVKLNKYLGSFECGIDSVTLGDHIGIDNTGKLIVDANGTIGTVVLMIAEGIGIIKLN